MVGLATYTAEALCQDVAAKKRRKGVLHPGVDDSADAYREVWGAFGRYLSACLQQRKGLCLGNFCKVGWLIERREIGKPSYRPLFRFSDKFCQTHMNREVARKLTAPLTTGAELCPFEDFNFSKAALKFSDKLTKDQVFSGLRALVQRLGEAISAGRCLDVALGDLGRLVSGTGGEPKFSFAPEVYEREGLEPPVADASSAAPTALQQARSATRRPASAALARRGSSAGPSRSLGIRGQPASQEPGIAAEAPVPSSGSSGRPKKEAGVERSTEPDEESQPEQGWATLHSSGSAPSLSTGSPRRGAAALTGLQFKRELAYKQALERQISEMEDRAARAIEEREAWGQHVKSCIEQERDAIVNRRLKNVQNVQYIQQQIDAGEQRRREQRREEISRASEHGFPRFEELTKEEASRIQQDQKEKVRSELDEQVKLNNALRNHARQHEREAEVRQLETSRREMKLLREAEREKRSYDREALLNSWNSDIRMKNVSKAIEQHRKGIPSSCTGAGPESRVSTAASSGGQGLCRPLSAGSTASRASRPTTACSRGLAGSTRRAPLGASRSLGQLGGGAVRAC